ncbi:hypothetical protein CRG98_000987 [Punica granatum]|uniref:Uncharacterized protein n=1 Tax=Punica granatum TaxID=22663 RepID=A0A2I0LD65_PUNGR|nr:hypothetical protein CRG98_000987 [Punica granatum]
MARYLASTEDLEIVVCCLVFQEIGLPPKVMKYPVKDRRVIGQLAESASQIAELQPSDGEIQEATNHTTRKISGREKKPCRANEQAQRNRADWANLAGGLSGVMLGQMRPSVATGLS